MHRALQSLSSTIVAACVVACAPASIHSAAAPSSEGPSAAPREPLAWAELSPATFARAHAEKRFLVIDGSAEWCHWCHVMEAVTYHDPEVQKLLEAHFLAVKVDVDAHPDFEERYGNWGWPATVLMTDGGEELGKYKGYLPPGKFAEILRAVVDGAAASATDAEAVRPKAPSGGEPPAMSDREIAEVAASTERQLEEYWDPKEASWGHLQKVPLYWDNAWALGRAHAGDESMRTRILFTLDRQRSIIDSEWGGICQYSTDGDWRHPHYEKLLAYQAGAIDNYATAYALTGDEGWLRTARLVRGFVDRFLTSPEGAFYVTMDADLNAHDPGKAFVTGQDYYAKSDSDRRALGIPRVDDHEYAGDNGLAIAAYVTFYQETRDPSAASTAERAASRIVATHATASGGVTHGVRGDEKEVLYLADNAAFGFGLARLYEATRKAEHLEAARRIAGFLVRELFDAQGGGFFASTPDPNAVGVFAARRKPFEENVMAVRFLAKMARLTATQDYREAIARSMRGIGTKEAIEGRGRMVGELLLAIEETRGVR